VYYEKEAYGDPSVSEITDDLVYEDKKPSYRSEVTRILATNPDLIMLEGYTPDSIVMAKEIYKAGYKGAILGPSPVVSANVGLSFSAGILDKEGMYLLRPSWLIDPYWAVEGFAGLSPRSEKDVFLGGMGFVLRLVPGAVIGPYAGVGLGAAHIRPKADNYVDKEETLMALSAGGGLEITFKKQITVRLDARNWSLFNQNHANNGQEYSGGLAIFF